jgi:hypothetical protein
MNDGSTKDISQATTAAYVASTVPDAGGEPRQRPPVVAAANDDLVDGFGETVDDTGDQCGTVDCGECFVLLAEAGRITASQHDAGSSAGRFGSIVIDRLDNRSPDTSIHLLVPLDWQSTRRL